MDIDLLKAAVRPSGHLERVAWCSFQGTEGPAQARAAERCVREPGQRTEMLPEILSGGAMVSSYTVTPTAAASAVPAAA